jgi:sec-independent protein translocase protein TatB
MFNVGGMELLAISLVALVVLGPDRLPAAIRQVGAAVGKVREFTDGFQVDLRAAVAEAEAEAETSTDARDEG